MTKVLFNGETINLPSTEDINEIKIDSIEENINFEDTKEFNPNEIYDNVNINYNLEDTIEFDERIDN